MSTADKIAARLQKALSPTHLEVIDESHLHKGHAGARPEGETHFRVRIASAHFAGKTRLARQRAVNGAIGDLFNNPIHALAIEVLEG